MRAAMKVLEIFYVSALAKSNLNINENLTLFYTKKVLVGRKCNIFLSTSNIEFVEIAWLYSDRLSVHI